MRQERTVQASIFDVFATHGIGHELKAMSQWLDEHCDLIGLVARDLVRVGVKAAGRQGLPAEAVLRCALLKQYRQLSYQELAFHLERTPPRFAPSLACQWSWNPPKSVLQKTISAIRAETWEQINRALLVGARQTKLEDGAVVRLDSTATSALMHEPSDSRLLWDAVRIEAGERAVGRSEHAAHRSVADPTPSLLAAGRTHRSDRASGGCWPARQSRPATNWSACSKGMPISSSKAAATPNTATSST
jgi:IS5 family transposase